MTFSPIPPLSDAQPVNAFAFDALQNLKLAQTTIKPTYKNDPQNIDVVLSTRAEALNSATQVASQLLNKFQTPVQEILAVSLQATEIDIQKNKQVIAQLQNQIAQVRRGNLAQQVGLEIEQSQQINRAVSAN